MGQLGEALAGLFCGFGYYATEYPIATNEIKSLNGH
jgi:hypothetical protein